MIPKTSVSSRFVSESELDSHPSSSSTKTEEYDPRSLFEKLQSQKEAKNAKYDEMFKLSNQFRGIDEGESDFLARVEEERKREEMERRKRERDEVEMFREMQKGGGKGVEGLKLGLEKRENKVEGEKKEGGGGIGGVGGGAGGGKKKRKASSALLGVVKKKPSTSSNSKLSSGEGPKGNAVTKQTPQAPQASKSASAQQQISKDDSSES